MLEEDDGDPNADGAKFEAVGKYEEPEEPGPGSLGPDVPEAPDLTAAAEDADPAVQNLFWGLVVLFNVAILALSVGAMLILFGTDPTLGVQVLLVGLVLAVYGGYRYRDAKATVADIVSDGDGEDNG